MTSDIDDLLAQGTRVARWQPAGPVSRAFVTCRRLDYSMEGDDAGRLLRLFNGPVGCGKTSTIFADNVFYLPMRQPRDPDDGVRRFKFVVIHKDYRKLWRGPIPTYFKTVPVAKRDWTGSKDGPAVHTYRAKHPADGGLIEVITEFAAVGDQDAEDFARGYEPTRAALMEADLLAPDVLEYVEGRCGRYPGRKGDYQPFARGVDMDCNAPEFGSWIEDYLDGQHPEFNVFRAPPALIEVGRDRYQLNPEAENLQHLPSGYYAPKGKKRWYVQRMYLNKPGIDPKGAPVYESFDPSRHFAPYELEPDPNLPLGLGLDQGMYPALVIGQRTHEGVLRVIDTIDPGPGTGASRFGQLIVEKLAEPRYAPWRGQAGLRHSLDRRGRGVSDAIRAGCDPAGFHGGDEHSELLSDKEWVVKVARVAKIVIRPACHHRDNVPSVRQDALGKLMLERTAGGDEKLQLCPVKCKDLGRSMASGYQWTTVKEAHGSGTRVVKTLKKDNHSHRVEAVEYLNLMLGGASAFRDRDERLAASKRPSGKRAILNDRDARARGVGGRRR